MNKPNEPHQKSGNLSQGVYAGFLLWLFFLTCFLLMRYPVNLSIVMGAVGGLAGGLISAWWQTGETDTGIQETYQNNLVKPFKTRSKKSLTRHKHSWIGQLISPRSKKLKK